MKIRTKILMGFIIVSLLTGVIGLTGYYSMKNIMQDQYEIADVRLPSVEALLIMNEAQTAVVVGERGLINKDMMDKEIRQAQYTYIEKAFQRAEKARKTYEPLPQTKEEKDLWEEFVPQWNKWKTQDKLIIDLSRQKDELIASGVPLNDVRIQKNDEQVYEAYMKSRELFLKAESTLSKIINVNINVANEANIQGKMEYEKANKIVIIVIIIGMFLAIFLGMVISNTIKKPIHKTIDMLKNIAQGEGDLTKRLNIHSKDEIGELTEWFNLFVDKIQDLVGQAKYNADHLAESSSQIALSIDQVNQGIEQIAGGISNVSDGAQNNASVVEETTASIEELASSIEVVSRQAKDAFDKSNDTLEFANQGANNVKEVVDANHKVNEATKEVYKVIGELKDSSDQIGEIVSMITNISQQTNLLALNAAIEAARAGEHGRGFAVVADEVRKLAEESTESASSITVLIDEIQIKADHASQAISQGQALVGVSVEKSNIIQTHFQNILNSIKDINGKMKTISSSANQQSQSAEEMTKAMDEISASTQDNASAVQQINAVIENQASAFEEIGASAEELKNVALKLKERTDKFKVD
ncbi:methyl-accepting chemotaxis protein [Inediibacterium massiliense]|uniref:methyl-accepting chemotaxis protein n=1 Tax=Inediibacterium massiliense TaxID=1658111 RepID=UPI0018FE5032|nr:methyl-accepting chemotaxis protein [Inediibacterium massiliense]